MRRLSIMSYAGLAFAALGVACSRPVSLDWKVDLAAASLCTPLVTSKFIAVGHERGVSLVEPNGDLRCTFEARGEVIGRPATDGALIFFGSTNYIFYAIDAACREVWKFATRDRIKSDALYEGGRVFLSSYDGHVYALDAASGAQRWTFPPPEPPLEEALAALAAEVVAGEIGAPRKVVSATRTLAIPSIPPAAGVSADPTTEVGDFSYSSPVIAAGVLYIGNLDGHIYALGVSDGRLLWRFATGAAVTSTPIVAERILYTGSNDTVIYALELSTAEGTAPSVLWQYATRDWVNSTAALADGVLYVGSNDRHVYALAAQTGAFLWRFETKGPVVSTPAVYQNLLVATGGSGDGTIYVLSRSSGALFWQHATEGKIESDPVVAGDHVYVTSADHYLYAYRIRQVPP